MLRTTQQLRGTFLFFSLWALLLPPLFAEDTSSRKAYAAILIQLVAGEFRLADVEISLSRSECAGTCPNYSVSILGDGTVSYDGRSHVAVTGTRTSFTSKEKVVELIDSLFAMGFSGLDETYHSRTGIIERDGLLSFLVEMTNHSARNVLIVTLGAYKQTVSFESAYAPIALVEFARSVDEAAGVEKWVVDPATPLDEP